MRTPIAAALALALLVPPAAATFAADPPERNTVLPAELGPHWLWVADVMLRRAALFDGDTARFLGQVPAGNGIVAPHRSRDGREIYLAETYYARGTRGARTDLVSITDARTLAPLGEIEIPGKRSEHTSWVGGSALSDDGRFLAVFNLNPATSLSIVDVARRRFVSEIEIPGCGLVFAAGRAPVLLALRRRHGARRSAGRGGRRPAIVSTERFFDGGADPLIEKGVRHGDRWLFVSYEGVLHTIDVSGPALTFGETWPLFSAAELEQGWRVGGLQTLALHAASAGSTRSSTRAGRTRTRIPARTSWCTTSRNASAYRRSGCAARPRASCSSRRAACRAARRTGCSSASCRTTASSASRDAGRGSGPLRGDRFPSTLAVYDATTGAHLRDVREVGVATTLIQLPRRTGGPGARELLRFGLLLLLASGAAEKLRDSRRFRAAVAGYALLPERAIGAAATAFALGEAALAAALLAPAAAGVRAIAAVAAALLFAVYGAAIAINLARGRRAIDCGCGGPAARVPLSGWLVARNALLVAAALLCAGGGAARRLRPRRRDHDRRRGRRPRAPLDRGARSPRGRRLFARSAEAA